MGGRIELKQLTKRFGGGADGTGILAVDRVSFAVEPGEVLGFLGPNGAGKSTTMKMVTGYLPATSGAAVVCGHDVSVEPLAAKAKLGYLPEGAPAYPDMTPMGFLRFVAQVRGLHGEGLRRAVDSAAERVHLEGVLHQPIETLSKGFKRRVGLAQAILHDPEVLIMDEPTDGLDPNQKHEVRALIRSMARAGEGAGAKAIVLSTHILEEVGAVCTRAVVIAKGRIVADESPEALMARSRFHGAVSLAVLPPPGADVFAELKRVPGVDGVEPGEASKSGEGTVVSCTVLAKRGQAIAHEVSLACKAKGWRVERLQVERGRLDDVFRDLTLGAQARDGASHGPSHGASHGGAR